jgi:hypothetical protein
LEVNVQKTRHDGKLDSIGGETFKKIYQGALPMSEIGADYVATYGA